MDATIKSILVSLIIAFIVSVTATACFDPSDNYSLEVVLSKPGVKYDLGLLDNVRGVVEIGEGHAYVWRSHVYPSEIIVIVSLQQLSLKTDADKYLSIRIEGKAVIVNRTVYIYYMKTSAPKIIDIEEIERTLIEHGWSINTYPGEGYIKTILIKNTSGRTITVPMTISYINGTTVFSAKIKLEHGSDNAIVESLREALEEITGDADITLDKKSLIEQGIEPSRNVTEATLKETLEYELKWLIGLGVIEGLTDDDVEEILSSIREGMAGWNNRLVYLDDGWYPYNRVVGEIPGGVLVKTSTGCGFDIPLELIPGEPPTNTVTGYTSTHVSIPGSDANTHQQEPIDNEYTGSLSVLTTTTNSVIDDYGIWRDHSGKVIIILIVLAIISIIVVYKKE